MKNLYILLALVLIGVSGHVSAQCNFTGLAATYCESDMGDTLVPSGPGLFSGPGMTGDYFDPGAAGPGVHQIDFNQSDPTVYTVDQTGTFSPTASSGTPVSLSDDAVSGMLPIGFTFNFFGTNYTDFYISSNGFISFDPTVSQGCCSGGILPTNDAVNNVIAWSWNDLYPPGSGSITYETIGTAPNRILLVTFDNQSHCCNSNGGNTGQIKLFETTNIIEIHCTSITNDGSNCTQGIENFDGSIGYVTPGRNSTTWTTNNDYVAFLPAVCNISQTVEVYASPTVTGMADIDPACIGDSVVFTGNGADTYVWDNGVTNGVPYVVNASGTFVVVGTEATYGCSGTDTVYLMVNDNPTISVSPSDEMYGNDGSVSLSILTGIPPYTFDWDFDGTGDNDDSNDLFGVPAGTYTVTMTDGNGCQVTESAVVGSQVGILELDNAVFSIHPNPSSGEFNITIKDGVDLAGYSLIVEDVQGRVVLNEAIDSQNIKVNISSEVSGSYFVKISNSQIQYLTRIVLNK